MPGITVKSYMMYMLLFLFLSLPFKLYMEKNEDTTNQLISIAILKPCSNKKVCLQLQLQLQLVD